MSHVWGPAPLGKPKLSIKTDRAGLLQLSSCTSCPRCFQAVIRWAPAGEMDAAAGLQSKHSPRATIPWLRGARPEEGTNSTVSKLLRSHPKLSSFSAWLNASDKRSARQHCSQKEQLQGSAYISQQLNVQLMQSQPCRDVESGLGGDLVPFSSWIFRYLHSERQSTQNVRFWEKHQVWLLTEGFLYCITSIHLRSVINCGHRKMKPSQSVSLSGTSSTGNICATSPWDDSHSWNKKQQLSLTWMSGSDWVSD